MFKTCYNWIIEYDVLRRLGNALVLVVLVKMA